MDHDKEIISSVFIARVALAKETEEESVVKARREWKDTQAWVLSPATRQGSFHWYCDFLDLEADAVRRAIRERRH